MNLYILRVKLKYSIREYTILSRDYVYACKDLMNIINSLDEFISYNQAVNKIKVPEFNTLAEIKNVDRDDIAYTRNEAYKFRSGNSILIHTNTVYKVK